MVLKGGVKSLEKVKAVFIEISILPDLYIDGVQMDKITTTLKDYGFYLVGLGTDTNYTGNALYIKL